MCVFGISAGVGWSAERGPDRSNCDKWVVLDVLDGDVRFWDSSYVILTELRKWKQKELRSEVSNAVLFVVLSCVGVGVRVPSIL